MIADQVGLQRRQVTALIQRVNVLQVRSCVEFVEDEYQLHFKDKRVESFDSSHRDVLANFLAQFGQFEK